MEKTNSSIAVTEVIDMCWQTSHNKSFEPDTEFLRKYNFSPEHWKCFVELIRDLDLNESGIGILLDEIVSGRYVLKCDRPAN